MHYHQQYRFLKLISVATKDVYMASNVVMQNLCNYRKLKRITIIRIILQISDNICDILKVNKNRKYK